MRKKSTRPPACDLAIVLVSTRNPLNIGAAARAMSNFGFDQLRVVNPYGIAFREAKSAVGASAILTAAREYSTVADAVADCSLVIGTTAARNRKLDHPLRSLDEAARLIHKHSGRVALLFGSEKRGLTNHDLSYCHWLLRIPTRENHPSMNLGQAVALCVYKLARRSGGPTRASTWPAPAARELHRLADILAQTLQAAGYPKAAGAEFAERIHRLVCRLRLSEEDTQLLSGMFRQMLWKMRGN